MKDLHALRLTTAYRSRADTNAFRRQLLWMRTCSFPYFLHSISSASHDELLYHDVTIHSVTALLSKVADFENLSSVVQQVGQGIPRIGLLLRHNHMCSLPTNRQGWFAFVEIAACTTPFSGKPGKSITPRKHEWNTTLAWSKTLRLNVIQSPRYALQQTRIAIFSSVEIRYLA